jgi:hypothetical protein
MAPRRSRTLDEPIDDTDSERTFEQSEEHQILQRIATLEALVIGNDAQYKTLFASADSRIRQNESDIKELVAAHEQSEGGRAMRIAIASAIGFAMSVAAFFATTIWGQVTP